MQMNRKHWKRQGTSGALRWAACLLVAATQLVDGCGSGKSSSGNSLSSPPAASQYNNYAGTQTYELLSNGYQEIGGIWNITLDDANQFFTYTDVSIPPNNFLGNSVPPYPIEGSFKSANGFLKLTLNGKSAGSGGYAVEIPGRAAILRPGDTSMFPVISVQASTSACPAPLQNTTFEFLTLALPHYSQAPVYAAYGSLQASSSGTAWKFSNLQMFAHDGTSLNPPTPSAGLCSYTQEGYVTNILPAKETQNLPWTVAVGPSGYLVVDQGQGDGLAYQGTPVPDPSIGPFGLVGFPQPSTQIDTSGLVGGKYIGFAYEPYNGDALRPVTQPIAFNGGSGTVATGGLYPNDDVTQTPPGNISLDLGPQDSGVNGLYKSVTLTTPDTYNGCAFETYGGTDANGNPTCIAYGVAIAGLVEGKYVLYVTVADRSLETRGITGAVLEYFLYQQ